MNKTWIAGAALGLLLLVGCGTTAPATSSTTAPTADAAAWGSMVSADALKLSTDLSNASDVLGTGDLVSSETSVNVLATDVASFQNDLEVNPAPPQFEKSAATLKTALEDYSTGCRDFEAGAADNDAGGIASATTLFEQANGLLNSAVSEIG